MSDNAQDLFSTPGPENATTEQGLKETNSDPAAQAPAVIKSQAPMPVQQVSTLPQTVQEVEDRVARAEALAKGMETLRRLSVRATSAADWVDESGNPYLQWSGGAKVAPLWGIRFSPPVLETEKIKDEVGEYYVFTYRAMTMGAGVEMPCDGHATTRDDFFAKRSRDGQTIYLPLSEIDITDVKKKALTNMLNRGLKNTVGLSFTWDEIIEYSQGKITPDNCRGKVAFSSGAKGGKVDKNPAETQKKRSEIWDILMDMCGGNGSAAGQCLKKLTAFGDFKGLTDITKVSEKQVNRILPDVHRKYEEWKKAGTKKSGSKSAPSNDAPPPPTEENQK